MLKLHKVTIVVASGTHSNMLQGGWILFRMPASQPCLLSGYSIPFHSQVSIPWPLSAQSSLGVLWLFPLRFFFFLCTPCFLVAPFWPHSHQPFYATSSLLMHCLCSPSSSKHVCVYCLLMVCSVLKNSVCLMVADSPTHL